MEPAAAKVSPDLAVGNAALNRIAMSNPKLVLTAVAAAVVAGTQPSRAQPPTPMPTQDFVKSAAASDQYEILAARVANIEAQDPNIRAFAKRMVQDHTKTSQALRQATTASGTLPPPMGLSDDGQKLLAQLQSLTGPDFDKAYGRQQVLAHTQALVVEQRYAANGADANIRRAAQSAVPIIQRHLEMARQLPQ